MMLDADEKSVDLSVVKKERDEMEEYEQDREIFWITSCISSTWRSTQMQNGVFTLHQITLVEYSYSLYSLSKFLPF